MIDDNQLEHFRERQLASLHDICRRLDYSYGTNDYSEEVATWTEVEEDLPCGLDMSSGNEIDRTNDTVLQYDAVIRLPISEIWDSRDKIMITKRFGEVITPITYEIVSPIQRGPSGIRMLLKQVSV